MPGLAQIAPAFNLFFTTGVIVALAGASAPLIFLISMVGMCATASSLAQFAGVYPSAGSFITYITRAIGTKVAVAIGVITILGYMIAIAENVLSSPHIWGFTQIITILYGVLVVAPVVVGLKFGVRVTAALYAFEVVRQCAARQRRALHCPSTITEDPAGPGVQILRADATGPHARGRFRASAVEAQREGGLG
jgi:amino acid transporter